MNQPAVPGFELRSCLAPLIRHRALILTFVVAAAASSVLFTYVVSEKYLATTTVLYQPREAVSFRPKTRDALGFPMPLVALESIGNTLEEVLKSGRVLDPAVRTLRLDVRITRPATNRWVAMYRETKDQIQEWREQALQLLKYGRLLPRDPVREAVQGLERNLAIKRTAKAYTFQLQAADGDPARAALIVDTLAAILSDVLADEQAKGAKGSREKIEPRLRQSAAEIAATRETLERFKTSSGVSSLSEELSLKLKSISNLQEDLTHVQNQLRSLEGKRGVLDAQLRSEQPSVKYSSTTSNNPLVEQLRLDLARLDVERSGLLERFTPHHQDVRAVDAKIEQVRQRLGVELDKTVSSESVRVNDIYQKVRSDKLSNDAEIAMLAAKAGSLASAIQRETSATQKLTRNEPRLNELALQLKAAEEAYQLLNESYEEARLTESRSTSELVILNQASVPTAPARPIKILHVATSLLLSLALAVGFCFFVDALDPSIRSIDQAEGALGIPVFASIPAVDAGRRGRDPLLLKL